jgi:hypothetical protein
MAGQYAAKAGRLVERYSGRVQPAFARGIRSAFSAGEWAFAVAELASALVLDAIAVASDDKALFQELLRSVELSPDTPADIADRLRVGSPAA